MQQTLETKKNIKKNLGNYLKAAKCEEVDHFPVWLMRQAGRYMKTYQNLRKKYSLIEVLKTPELCCEVTLQPINAFGMDAAIIFSDILVLPDGLGLGLEYQDLKGPSITRPINNQTQIDSLDISFVADRLSYVMESIRFAKLELKKTNTPLIGFAGSPFTIATYITGDGRGCDLKKLMPLIFSNPAMVHSLMNKIADATVLYLNAQIKAGVDALQIFDSRSNVLSWEFFKELSLPYIKKIIREIDNPKNIPITVFGTNYSSYYPLLTDSCAQVISVDSKADIETIRKNLPKNIALQGNLDPFLLLASRDILKKETLKILDSMKGSKGFIFNLGHGVMPSVPEDNVKFLVDLIQNYKAK